MTISRRRFIRTAVTLCACCAAARTGFAGDASPHWSYEGKTGPDHWAELSDDFKSCQVGQKQTPIDLTGASQGNEAPVSFDYRPFPLRIVNNGHTIQVNAAPGSSCTIAGTRYELLQFHFHHPSEHTVDGKAMEIELHLVHKAASGGLAVVGVFFTPGQENAALKPVFDQMPAQKSAEAEGSGTIDPNKLLPQAKGFYRYSGSLTTPPCSEGIVWTIFSEPLELSPAQIAQFAALFKNNARPVQPLNGRSLVQVN